MAYELQGLKDRAILNRSVREYFDDLGHLEVETPLLAESAIPEAHIELFRTERIHLDGGTTPMYLLPSPEFWLKQVLAAGVPSLYQIGRCFRNGEQLDRWHRLEFSMLEWYSIDAGAEDNIPRMEQVLGHCIDRLAYKPGDSVAGAFRCITMNEAFEEFAGFSLEDDLRDAGLAESIPGSSQFEMALLNAGKVLAARLRERTLPVGTGNEDADDLFHRLFLNLVEDRLPSDRPLVLSHWPRLVPTLATGIPGTPWVERWELFIGGVEVANCYGEETGLAPLETYWSTESIRKQDARVPVEGREDWPGRVAEGMPRCSGVAVGLDRMLALVRGDDDLQGLDLLPINDMIRR